MGWNDRMDDYRYTPEQYEVYIADVIARADEARKDK